jgi:hypothetical protein
MKPVIEMSFDSIQDVEELYKAYAHDGGVLFLIGSQNLALGDIVNKEVLLFKGRFQDKEQHN